MFFGPFTLLRRSLDRLSVILPSVDLPFRISYRAHRVFVIRHYILTRLYRARFSAWNASSAFLVSDADSISNSSADTPASVTSQWKEEKINESFLLFRVCSTPGRSTRTQKYKFPRFRRDFLRFYFRALTFNRKVKRASLYLASFLASA